MIFICSHTSNIPYTPQEPYHIILPIDFPDRPNIAYQVKKRRPIKVSSSFNTADFFGPGYNMLQPEITFQNSETLEFLFSFFVLI